MKAFPQLINLILLLISIPVISLAQQKSDKIKPQWLKTLPIPSNPTFIYSVESAEANNLADARQACLSGLVAGSGLEKGMTVVTDYDSREVNNIIWENDMKTEYAESSFSMKSSVKGKKVDVHCMKIDEYWERKPDGRIYLHTLYARSQIDTEPNFDQIRITSQYGGSALWRSAIIPGWGQFYKGAKWKGGLVLGGAALLGSGIVLAENQRIAYMNMVQTTHDVDAIMTYATRSTNWEIGRNVCIGALSALYVYNLIDALAAPGARRILPTGKRGRNYAIVPAVMPDGSAGLYAAISF